MKLFKKFALILLGLLAILGAGLWAAASRWQSEVMASLARDSKIVQTARGPMEYVTLGEGPDVLVLHGSMGGYDQGLLIAQAVGGRGFKYIVVSRPGYLRTRLETGATFEAQADAYRRGKATVRPRCQGRGFSVHRSEAESLL